MFIWILVFAQYIHIYLDGPPNSSMDWPPCRQHRRISPALTNPASADGTRPLTNPRDGFSVHFTYCSIELTLTLS